MSLTIAGSSLNQLPPLDHVDHFDHEGHNQKPLPTPTTGEETLQLASTGQPAAEIAANLGLPITEVNSTLGAGSSASTQTGAISALSARLSVLA